ncbi:hypothetical protein BDP27DRAFT_1366577 [Rhodocollybia butyracea]|uniref:Uncharacterized protein n=1 Tax=Rhodocollybia butyracea TaxID=206335 RepID=A0A9P5U4X3_9AGAR|nr:hypothetical protein BDP27DRAFT_1366577 [Rhodocollybia butyracea]
MSFPILDLPSQLVTLLNPTADILTDIHVAKYLRENVGKTCPWTTSKMSTKPFVKKHTKLGNRERGSKEKRDNRFEASYGSVNGHVRACCITLEKILRSIKAYIEESKSLWPQANASVNEEPERRTVTELSTQRPQAKDEFDRDTKGKVVYRGFLDHKAGGADIVARLLKMKHEGGPHVFPKILTYKNADDKLRWSRSVKFSDPHWTTVSVWTSGGKGGKETCLVFAYVLPSSAAVTKSPHKQIYPSRYYQEWHTYAIAFIRVKGNWKKRVMLVWDTGLDQNQDPKPAGLYLYGTIEELWKAENKPEVYVNTNLKFCFEGRCLERAVQRLESWAAMGDMEFSEEGDPRSEWMRKLPSTSEYYRAEKILGVGTARPRVQKGKGTGEGEVVLRRSVRSKSAAD